MFKDLTQKGNQTAIKRSICGLIGAAGFIVIFFFNVFGLETDVIEHWKWIVIAVCALVAIASVVNWIRAANTSLMKNIDKFCAKTADPAATMARLEKIWNEGYNFGIGRMDSEYIILVLGLRTKIIPLENAVWVYKKTTRQQYTTHTHLFVCYLDDKYQSVALNPGAVDAITSYIYKTCPDMAVGYDVKLEKCYNSKDMQGLKEYALVQRTGVKV